MEEMMSHDEENGVNPTSQSVQTSPSLSQPTTAETRIHWADDGTDKLRPDLEAQFEAARARNWITDSMVRQYQKYWHCSRSAAVERLLAKSEK
jgi:hypothetical protein